MTLDKPITHAEFLARRIQELFAGLEAAVEQKAEFSIDDVDELKSVVNATLALQGRHAAVQDSLPYAAERNAADAAAAHLQTTTPYTLTREDLAQAILLGGWGRDLEGREHKARVAIGLAIGRYHRIVEHKGKLALNEEATPPEESQRTPSR